MADEVSTGNSQKLPARPKWSSWSLKTISLWALSEMKIKREVSSKSHHNSVMWNLSVPKKLTLFFCLCKVLLQFTQFPLFFPYIFHLLLCPLFHPFIFSLTSFTVPLQLQFLLNLKKYTFHTGFYRINSVLIETCEKLHKRKKFLKN